MYFLKKQAHLVPWRIKLTRILLGTRGSKLALAQANIVKNQIEDKLGRDTEIITIKTLGDKDKTTQLHRFRGQGVFTSALENKLIEGSIDIAVHSLKDLPVIDSDGLEIVAYLKRHDPTDTLLIKKAQILNTNPIKIKDYTRIATGSLRRQSQIRSLNATTVLLDIRGNVNTRISRLETNLIDGLIVASAVFERLELDIPDGIEKIRLPIHHFPTAPGQGVIAIQTKKNEFQELNLLNHDISKLAVISERSILEILEGSCELSLGLNALYTDNLWELSGTMTDKNWDLSKENQLSRFKSTGPDLGKLIENFNLISTNASKEFDTDRISGKRILLVKERSEDSKYKKILEDNGAIVHFYPMFEYSIDYSFLEDTSSLEFWNTTNWVVLTSQRAIEPFAMLNRLYPRNGYKVAAIGPATANKLRSHDLPVHLVAKGNLTSLQEQLITAREIYPGNVLFLSGEHITGLPTPDSHRLISYKTKVKKAIDPLPFKPEIIVLFSSLSSRKFLEHYQPINEKWIAIGASTSKELSKLGINNLIAPSPTPEGILSVIMR